MSILFQSDWTNANGKLRAIPHRETTNETFLRTAALLRKLGVRNYAFPLCLYDPDLRHVDVHDLEDNTPENEIIRHKVLIEARRNVWYFLRECVRVPAQGGGAVQYRLDRSNLAMTWCFMNGIDYCGMAPRQCGKDQKLDSLIKTPDGWSTMGSMKVGSDILAHDGTVAKVIGVYPQGVKPVYKITLDDGSSTECGAEHLWRVYDSKGNWRILQLDEFWSDFSKDTLIPKVSDTFEMTFHQIISVQYAGDFETQCIEIDHPDHLYITDDNIVTHNTIGAVCLIGWIMYSSGESFSIGHYCKDNALREQNVKRVRDVAELLPFWWLAEDKFRDKKNTHELYYHALGTHFQTTVAQADDRKADNNARGLTQPVQWIDEAEFCVNIGISYPTMLGATTAARESARANGKPYSNIITTTAGDPSNDACKEAAAILDGAMSFTEHLYDLPNKDKLHEVVEASSSQKMVLGVFSHLQLGRDNKWLRDIINRLKSTREQVMRDFLNRRVTIQDEPIIPKHILAQITASEREPDHIQIMSSKFVIKWYIPKEEVNSQTFRDRPIVVGCDSSEMIGKDATTLVGVDPRDFSVVFTFRCNEGNINIVGAMIAQLLLMFPKFLWVPENKSSGTSLIDIVTLLLRKEGHNPFMRIFNWIVDRKHEVEFAKFNIRDTSLLDTSAKRYFGIKTDKSKRDELYGATLLTAAEKACNRIRDKNLISEISSLTVRNGRVDHEVGCNDDTVIAFLMAMFAILNGRHLDVYGIKPGTIMSYVAPGQPDKNKVTQEQQKMIHSKIEELENKLKYQKDPTLKLLLEKDIDVMKGMIKHTQVLLPETADEFIRDPRKFTDPTIAEASRTPVQADDMERSLRSIMGLSS